MKRNSDERKLMLKKRREEQLARTPTIPHQPDGKYIPAGKLKNTKPYNR